MAEGTVIGGNLLTYNFLQGSEYVPSVDNAILILEDNGAEGPNNVENQLQSLINQSWFATVRGILIGRFKSGSKVTRDKLFTIIKTKPKLEKIAIIANVDFGHTAPMVTFPIGGRLIIDARDADAVVEIVEH